MSGQINLKLLYFAQLGEDLACPEEILALPVGSTLSELKKILCQRGGNWHKLEAKEIHCALNQSICKHDSALHEGDEIAFFPPVTGG